MDCLPRFGSHGFVALRQVNPYQVSYSRTTPTLSNSLFLLSLSHLETNTKVKKRVGKERVWEAGGGEGWGSKTISNRLACEPCKKGLHSPLASQPRRATWTPPSGWHGVSGPNHTSGRQAEPWVLIGLGRAPATRRSPESPPAGRGGVSVSGQGVTGARA